MTYTLFILWPIHSLSYGFIAAREMSPELLMFWHVFLKFA